MAFVSMHGHSLNLILSGCIIICTQFADLNFWTLGSSLNVLLDADLWNLLMVCLGLDFFNLSRFLLTEARVALLVCLHEVLH